MGAPFSKAQMDDRSYKTDFPGSDLHPTDRTNWMAGLDPHKVRISQIVWPGTHDSATNGIGVELVTRPFGECQSLSIYEQLKMGARVLDIRVQQDQLICHGALLSYNIDVVINDVKKFLEETQFEIIILEIRTEFGHENPPDFDGYLEDQLGEYLIHQDDRVFNKTICELLPKRVICVWKPRDIPQQRAGGPLWRSGYLRDNWIDSDQPVTKFEGNMTHLGDQQPVTARNYFYRVEHTLTPQADKPETWLKIYVLMNPLMSIIMREDIPALWVFLLNDRISPYARSFIGESFVRGFADRLQIFSCDFINEDFVDACVGLTSARLEGKA